MKSIRWLTAIVAVAVIFSLAAYAMAADASKTITGQSGCGGCSGVVNGCCVLLTDKDGGRWILRGDSASLKAAFQQRKEDKTMTATLVGKPVSKKDNDGKEYKEVKVSSVKVKS